MGQNVGKGKIQYKQPSYKNPRNSENTQQDINSNSNDYYAQNHMRSSSADNKGHMQSSQRDYYPEQPQMIIVSNPTMMEPVFKQTQPIKSILRNRTVTPQPFQNQQSNQQIMSNQSQVRPQMKRTGYEMNNNNNNMNRMNNSNNMTHNNNTNNTNHMNNHMSNMNNINNSKQNVKPQFSNKPNNFTNLGEVKPSPRPLTQIPVPNIMPFSQQPSLLLSHISQQNQMMMPPFPQKNQTQNMSPAPIPLQNNPRVSQTSKQKPFKANSPFSKSIINLAASHEVSGLSRMKMFNESDSPLIPFVDQPIRNEGFDRFPYQINKMNIQKIGIS